MPFYSAGDGDLKTAFVSDAWLLDQFVGNTLFCWGLATTNGQLGDNTVTSKSNPVQTVAGGNTWTAAFVGSNSNSSGAVKNDGTLWTWGSNNQGQLGDNTRTNRSSPVQTITFAQNWKQLALGVSHTAAIKTDGTLWTWGLGTSGQLGDNTATSKSSPVQTIAFGNNWKQVACGSNYTAAIKTDGTLWAWGVNSFGQIGDNTIVAKSSPVQTVAFGNNWKQVSCGFQFNAAIKTDGTLWCWGDAATYGTLGDNTTVAKSSPVQTVAFGNNWKQVSCGNTSVGAIKNDGTLWCWGLGTSGQLGDNTATTKSSPVQTVAFGNNWKQVSCGNGHSAAIKTDGTLWTWGLGTSGQLGDNTATSKSSPVQTAIRGTNWKQVSCGSQHTAAVTNGDI